jgi:hypothetical protein
VELRGNRAVIKGERKSLSPFLFYNDLATPLCSKPAGVLHGFIQTVHCGSCLMRLHSEFCALIAGVAGVVCHRKKIKEMQFSECFFKTGKIPLLPLQVVMRHY